MAMSEDVSEEEAYVFLMEELTKPTNLTPPYDPPKFESMISPNALTSFFTPQTLKLID